MPTAVNTVFAGIFIIAGAGLIGFTVYFVRSHRALKARHRQEDLERQQRLAAAKADFYKLKAALDEDDRFTDSTSSVSEDQDLFTQGYTFHGSQGSQILFFTADAFHGLTIRISRPEVREVVEQLARDLGLNWGVAQPIFGK